MKKTPQTPNNQTNVVFLLVPRAERELPGTLYDITSTFFREELLTAYLSVPDSVCNIDGLGKGREIRICLRRHAGPDCRYVIPDDMAQFAGELRDHAIHRSIPG